MNVHMFHIIVRNFNFVMQVHIVNFGPYQDFEAYQKYNVLLVTFYNIHKKYSKSVEIVSNDF